ncbi:hypothetical protein GobsT_12620 [Gemmata obscuriglobus]|uniref:Uncharacterized protein n=1 Tax=Gemmata obscuriglobus TaxID=114 RepID=A0A2Z3H3D9_9BACT|nr:hypothetical protein [Gemmata obscuriglobus]AWM40278.1 hypothetical protein C1280_26925 [Gemmata obscuriglobus]QEG26522.1 hypothetical protein GobsT_12620 [Gemmata obscuriglobus]VTS01853.1 unnamed protein product [Gemmata obscuriglobus UQM 2246]
MSVVSANMTWTGRGGTDTFTRQRTYREQWEVITDNPLDDEEIVVGTAALVGLPRLGQPHPRFPFAVCVEIEAAQSEESPFHWLVSIKYDSNPSLPNGTSPEGAGQSPADIPENPLLRPVTWEVSFETTTEVAREWRVITAGNLAANFTPVRNSAKLPFDPGLQIEVARPVWRLTRNIPYISGEQLLKFENAINDRMWRGIPKWCAKVRGTRAGSKYENGVAFVEFAVEVALKNETWIPEVLDAGMMELVQLPTTPDGQHPVTWRAMRGPYGEDGPFPLDGQGRKLAADAEPVFLRGLPRSLQLQNFTALLGI